MRRGTVVDTVAVAQSIDGALAEAEKVSGVSVDGATFSINGQSVKTHSSKGAVAIAEGDHVSHDDMDKAVNAASIVQLPNNQRVLEIISGGYSVEAKWKGIGCAITTAAASKLSEWLINKKVNDVKKMSEDELVKDVIGFEVNPGRAKCLTLPVRVIKRLWEN
jgi:hypothetical protein